MMRAPIVCGIDASPTSLAAARFAHRIAERLSRPLDLVHVTSLPDEAAQLASARALQSTLGIEPRDRAVLRVESGLVADRLLEASRHAGLLVIGGPARRRGGSVASAVTGAAASPVVVVPRRATGSRRDPWSGRVVCAIRDAEDLAPAATAACWAGEFGLPLTLVHVACPRQLPVHPLGAPPPTGLLYGDRERIWAARTMLAELGRTVVPSAPYGCDIGVLVGVIRVELARLDDGCELLVVGPARATSARWRLRRRTVAYLMRRARCPVLVCPSPEAVLALGRESHREPSSMPGTRRTPTDVGQTWSDAAPDHADRRGGGGAEPAGTGSRAPAGAHR